MKIRYLGTAAAEGWPAMYCNCEHCKRARAAGGKNIRTRSQSLINEDLLIDYPADTYMHVLQNNLDLSAVSNCLITHPHSDHFMPMEFIFHEAENSARKRTAEHMDVYGVQAISDEWREISKDEKSDAFFGIETHLLEAYKTVKIGNYEVTPLPAEHSYNTGAFVYLITDGTSTLLYLLDTGVPKKEVLEWLAEHKVRADVVTYDCTMGIGAHCDVHMGLGEAFHVKTALEEKGVSDEKTISVLNHFSHNGMLIYDEIKPVAEVLGFQVAWDGMEVDF